jgi:hypothetical protein
MNRLAPTKAKHEQSQKGGFVMARKNIRDGILEKKDGKLTLRYRERVPNTTEVVFFTNSHAIRNLCRISCALAGCLQLWMTTFRI